MVKLTQSMYEFLKKFYKKEMALIMFGHLEIFTAEMGKEYCDWCKTDEGRQYLKGGSKYDSEYAKSIGVE